VAANDPGQPPADASADVTLRCRPRRLAIGAHPDDVEFGAGATLAKWAAEGCVVHHLICTDGSKGTWDVHADTVALAATRRREQADAARLIGGAHAGEVRYLGYVDGEL
jgi:LmbE family N-acetylglucosaminyl deacetylase